MLNALDLARAIAAGADTPPALLQRCTDTIAAREPDLAAFAHLDRDGARQRAADPALATAPLRGLPVAVKDIIDVAGQPTGMGSPVWADWTPRADSAIAAMIRRAGGVILGKATTTPFAFLDPAPTRNPRRPGHTPGGSSAGSAAAVAAGMVPLAIGTQTGGSVIRPASYCGVAALKPSFKLLPMPGVKPMSWSLDTLGLFAARVVDLAFALGAITGRDVELPAAPPPPRLAFVRSHVWSEGTADMRATLERAAETLRHAGATVTELELPAIFVEAYQAQDTIQGYEATRAMAWEWDHHRHQLSPLLRDMLQRGQAIDPVAYDDARGTARRARHALADLWTNFDAMLTPSAPGEAPAGLAATGTSIFNRLWTLMGNPCLNVPGLVGASGLPIGVQVVGRFGRDRAALAAAAFVERALAK